MTRTLLAVLTAFFLASCGGGGDAGGSMPADTAQAAPMAAGANEPMKAKVVAPDPTLLGGPVSVVNTTLEGNQVLRSIGATNDGGNTVAWISGTATLDLQRYDSLGTREGPETPLPITVDDDVSQALQSSALSVLGDGNVVVVYRAINHTTLPTGTISTKQGLYFQAFSPAGEQLTVQTEIASLEEVIHSRSPSLTGYQVVALADGGFVVAWTVRTFSAQFGYRATLYLQRYDSQAQPVGGFVQEGHFPALLYSLKADALGGFTVYISQWDDSFNTLASVIHYDTNSAAHEIVGPTSGASFLLFPMEGGYVLFTSTATGATRQMLDSAGNPVGDPAPMTSIPLAAHGLTDGTYVVFLAAGSGYTAQRYAAEGTAMGDPLPIPGATALPQAAALADGGFALAWTGPGTSGDTDVLTQRFIEVPSDRKKACLLTAKGLRGQERKAFMDTCLG